MTIPYRVHDSEPRSSRKNQAQKILKVMETCIRCQSPDKVSDLTIFLTKICLVLYICTTARKWHTPDQAHLTTENYQTLWLVSCIDFPRLLMSSKTTICYSEPPENITIFFAYFSLLFSYIMAAFVIFSSRL